MARGEMLTACPQCGCDLYEPFGGVNRSEPPIPDRHSVCIDNYLIELEPKDGWAEYKESGWGSVTMTGKWDEGLCTRTEVDGGVLMTAKLFISLPRYSIPPLGFANG